MTSTLPSRKSIEALRDAAAAWQEADEASAQAESDFRDGKIGNQEANEKHGKAHRLRDNLKDALWLAWPDILLSLRSEKEMPTNAWMAEYLRTTADHPASDLYDNEKLWLREAAAVFEGMDTLYSAKPFEPSVAASTKLIDYEGWKQANHAEESLARAIHALPGTEWTFWIEHEGVMYAHRHTLPPFNPAFPSSWERK